MKPTQIIYWSIAVIVAACVAALAVNQIWKFESIRTGHAEYNAKTGVWQWKGKR